MANPWRQPWLKRASYLLTQSVLISRSSLGKNPVYTDGSGINKKISSARVYFGSTRSNQKVLGTDKTRAADMGEMQVIQGS